MESDRKPLKSPTLGGRIREAYEGRGWTRAQFQRALQAAGPPTSLIQPKTISDWEGGKKTPRMGALLNVSKVTGYTLDELSNDPARPDDETGVLDDDRVIALLDRMGAGPVVRDAVRAELAAYPPDGGINRKEVVRVHRLLTQGRKLAETPEDAAWDDELRRAGGKRVDPAKLRAAYESEKSIERAHPGKSGGAGGEP